MPQTWYSYLVKNIKPLELTADEFPLTFELIQEDLNLNEINNLPNLHRNNLTPQTKDKLGKVINKWTAIHI